MKLKNFKVIYELNFKQMIRIKNEQEKLTVQNYNLRVENSELKGKNKSLKNENIRLLDQNNSHYKNRISQNYKYENVERKQKYFIQTLININQNNLLM